eukprot:527951_1
MNKENITPIQNSKHRCTINVDINGFIVSLSPNSTPPNAEYLFHSMFFEEELKKAPSHYRQQRWNKRRIQKRWNWKRGREREIYEKRAQYLKNIWIEMKKDYKANNNLFLSKQFVEKNSNLKINVVDKNSPDIDCKSTTDTDDSNMKEISLLSLNTDTNDMNIYKKQNKTVEINKRNKIMSKMEGKRKHIRRREKLIERIANGETLENFVDHQKFNNIYNQNNGKKKDNLLFSGTNQNKNYNHKKIKFKKSRKKTKSMKLTDFVEAAKQLSHPKKKNLNTKHTKIKKNKNERTQVSLSDIQAEQTKKFKAFNRKKRDEIHTMKLQNINNYSSKLFSNKLKKNIENNITENEEIYNEICNENDNNNFCINPLLNHSMNILNYDHMISRKKTIDEIYCGCSVFPCIPCCIEATNTLLIDARFVEKLLLPNSSLSELNGLFELKKQLKQQFKNKIIEILPIFERPYIHKQCQQLLLIQFQDCDNDDSATSALSLYHCWKQQIFNQSNKIKNKNKNKKINIFESRIEFVESWFAKSYFLQHSHLWSNIALNSMITIYDNNNKYIQNINKTARHCRCNFKRIVYFPPFNPKYSHSH